MKTKLCLTVAIILGYLPSIAFGQLPLQPGDTPAPVVDVFEVGLAGGKLTALITGPLQVSAGAAITFDISGTSNEDQELVFRPHVPDRAIVWDSGGQAVYAWIGKPGHYWAFWSVETENAAAVALWEFDVVEGPPDDPDDPVPSPDDAAFLRYVKGLTEKVRAANHDEIAATFRALAKRIESGELRSSTPIQAATLTALFGPAKTLNAEWGDWYNTLFPYLLNVKRLATQKDWARYYRLVARGIE